MEQLKERIRHDGTILPGNVLKVGNFLNQQIDIKLLDEIAAEFVRIFSNEKITKVMTIESSGIAIACAVARILKTPVVFCKKSKTNNISGDFYSTNVHSYTHNIDSKIIVPKEFIKEDDYILIIDDFLANGCALKGMKNLIKQASAICIGAGIVIEKGFQDGGKTLRSEGLRIESLAIIESMSLENGIVFKENEF